MFCQSTAGHRVADFTSQTPLFILTLIYIAQTTSEQTISSGISYVLKLLCLKSPIKPQ